VAAISRAAVLSLDDGTELKLMGVLLPGANDLPTPPADWPQQNDALAALDHVLRTRTAKIAATGAFTDRWNRRVAHAFAEDGSWVQAAIVDAGHARVQALPGETACIRELLTREAVARAKRIGMWASPAYEIRQARATRTLERLTGTFQIVEGWVANVGMSRTEVFLNFGRDWRWDFTAGIELRRSPDREAAVARLRGLRGKLVRVRGYIERRNGPFVTLAAPEVIEELPEGLAGGR
jgi:micrococcal nuclease